MTATKDFGNRLRLAREAKGLRVTELNTLAKLSAGSVSRLEWGDRTTVGAAVVAQLAGVLGVTMDWLWKGQGPAGPDVLAATILMGIDRRKLREVIEADPGHWRLSTIVQALQHDGPTGPDGVPTGGWNRLLSTLEAGEPPTVGEDETTIVRKRKRRAARRRP